MTKEKVQNIKSSHQANLENQGSDNLQHGWEIKKLGEVCELSAGGDVPKDNFSETKTEKYSIPIYANGEKNEGLYGYTNIAKVSKPSITVSARGTIGFSVKRLEAFFPVVRLIVVTPINQKELDLDFLDYSLKRIDFKHSGSSIPQLTVPMIRDYEIPLPPLPEQQRIVAILDETFSAIDKAKANAEQNLKNAKELFESYLQGVFENKGEGWEEQLFENCFKLKSGVNLTAKNMTEGEYPVFGGNGIAGYHNEYNLSGSNVIIGRVGALCGNVRHINENIWLTDNAFKVVDFKFDFDHSFLTYLLNHKDLRSYARQAAQPVISNSSLKDVVLFFPKSKTEQQTIVRQLDALRAETQKLEGLYQKKIDNLEELKKSILQKAFSGELSGGEPV
jgi:type I restriction enzyme S subunit